MNPDHYGIIWTNQSWYTEVVQLLLPESWATCGRHFFPWATHFSNYSTALGQNKTTLKLQRPNYESSNWYSIREQLL